MHSGREDERDGTEEEKTKEDAQEGGCKARSSGWNINSVRVYVSMLDGSCAYMQAMAACVRVGVQSKSVLYL